VAKATVIVQQTVLLRDAQAHGERLLVLGVDFLNQDDETFRAYASADIQAVRTDPVAFLNAPNHLILGRRWASRFGYRARETLGLATPEGTDRFEIWGFIDDEGVGRAFGGAVALMDYQAMQMAFGRGNNIDRIDIAVSPDTTPEAVAGRLRAALGEGYFVDRPERKNGRVDMLLNGLHTGLMLTSLIALLVGMFLIYNTMSISVVQRRREIGILRALGTTRGELLWLLTLEGALLGVVGSAVGIAMGIALAHLLLMTTGETVNEIFVQVAANHLHIDARQLLGCFALGVLSTTLSSWFPARQAARSRTVEILRAGPPDPPGAHALAPTRLDLLAIALFGASFVVLRLPLVEGLPAPAYLAVGTFMLGMAMCVPRVVQLLHWGLRPLLLRFAGVEVQLANESLPRNLLRSSATAAALMVGVGMALGFATFVGSFKASAGDWVEQSLPADLWVTSGARFGSVRNVLMDESLSTKLAALKGVAAVERARIDDVSYRGFPIKLLATDVDVFSRYSHMQMLEGTQVGATAALLHGQAVIVSENFARRFDVHLHDQIALGTQRGTQRFRVAGVFVDYTSDVGSVLLHRDTYLEHWSDTRMSSCKLYLAEGANREAVRRAIQARYGERYDLFVLTNQEIRAQVLDLLDQTFSVMHALEIVAIVIAVLGVVNALLANVLDRVREIGMLRALGMLRRQAHKMIVVEGVLIALAGVMAGIVLGFILGDLVLNHINVAQTGWHFPYRASWLWPAEMALLATATSAVAALYPARFAAALVVADALDYE
jgi:putative ABC transport system permease protein